MYYKLSRNRDNHRISQIKYHKSMKQFKLVTKWIKKGTRIWGNVLFSLGNQ